MGHLGTSPVFVPKWGPTTFTVDLKPQVTAQDLLSHFKSIQPQLLHEILSLSLNIQPKERDLII
jgi:hypothetical protein